MAKHPINLRANTVGDRPQVDPTAYIDPTAQLIGNVRVGPRAFVGPRAVIRADELDEAGAVGLIVIGPECNVQDGVVLHSLGGKSVEIGARVSLAHGCIVHGPCTIGDGSFIGFGAVVYKAALSGGNFVGHGAIVEGVELDPGVLVPAGSVVNSVESASRLSKVGPSEREFMGKVVDANLKLSEGYLGQGRPAP